MLNAAEISAVSEPCYTTCLVSIEGYLNRFLRCLFSTTEQRNRGVDKDLRRADCQNGAELAVATPHLPEGRKENAKHYPEEQRHHLNPQTRGLTSCPPRLQTLPTMAPSVPPPPPPPPPPQSPRGFCVRVWVCECDRERVGGNVTLPWQPLMDKTVNLILLLFVLIEESSI